MLNHPDAGTRYRNRAEELRVLAESITDPKIRADIEKWAKEYDLMAMCAGIIQWPKAPESDLNL